jgi:hypothetical protein
MNEPHPPARITTPRFKVWLIAAFAAGEALLKAQSLVHPNAHVVPTMALSRSD